MKKKILVLSMVVALVAALAMPMAVLASTTPVEGNPTATISITVPPPTAITLIPGTTSTATGTITVSANTATWSVSAADADTVTAGFMTPWSTGDAMYDPTPVKLLTVMSVIGTSITGVVTGATAVLPLGGAILTGAVEVDTQACTITFSQPVAWLDDHLIGDGITPAPATGEEPNTYRIVVTFTAIVG